MRARDLERLIGWRGSGGAYADPAVVRALKDKLRVNPLHKHKPMVHWTGTTIRDGYEQCVCGATREHYGYDHFSAWE